MKAVAVVQARMSSRRLPGKVLKPLNGVPSILRMMTRVARAERLDAAIVATSDHESDDPLAELLVEHGVECVRGSLEDVLGRFAGAVPECDAVVRLTGDCPLIDPALIDLHLQRFEEEQPFAQYVTNAVVRTFPDGLDVEVIARDLLMRAAEQSVTSFDREHVTPWIQRRARTVPITQETDYAALRWTLDTPEDYAHIERIYQGLEEPFTSEDIYRFLGIERPS